MKKAQVTLFIIMGIVALFATGLLLYYLGLQASRPAPGYDDISSVNTFVTSCISMLSDEAFDLIGKQGGHIFISQGGTSPDLEARYKDKLFSLMKAEGIDYVVPYGILRFGDKYKSPRKPPIVYYGRVLEYPWIYFPYTPHNQPVFKPQSRTYEGLIFGENRLPTLNRDDGLSHSIQEQIETYIEKKLKGCTAGFTSFPEYTITEKKVKATVLFAAEDTVINVTYPLEIRKKTGGSSTKADKFLVRKTLRMKKIHEVANFIINKDISNVEYDILSDSGKFYSMTLAKTPVYPNNNIGTFITISDGYSLSRGIPPYTFTFARQNRHPALHYIEHLDYNYIDERCKFVDKDKGIVDCAFEDVHELICGESCTCVHIEFEPKQFVVREGAFPEIAYDPDEDLLTSSSFIYTPNLPHSIDGDHDRINRVFTIRVIDPTLDDWQEITFNIHWDRTGCQG